MNIDRIGLIEQWKHNKLGLVHKLFDMLKASNCETLELQSKLNFLMLPQKVDIVYHHFFYFNEPYHGTLDENPPACCNTIDKPLHFITLTFDPSFYLPKTEGDQVNFFINLLYKNASLYLAMYGVFEHHKSGIIHFHGIFECNQDENKSINELLTNFRTSLTMKSPKAVKAIPVTNLDKLINEYLAKENFITIEKKI